MEKQELLNLIKDELDERDNKIEDLKDDLASANEEIDGLKSDLDDAPSEERVEELEMRADIVPESVLDVLSINIFSDMAHSLTHDQITELDEYAQKNFSNYRKILS